MNDLQSTGSIKVVFSPTHNENCISIKDVKIDFKEVQNIYF